MVTSRLPLTGFSSELPGGGPRMEHRDSPRISTCTDSNDMEPLVGESSRTTIPVFSRYKLPFCWNVDPYMRTGSSNTAFKSDFITPRLTGEEFPEATLDRSSPLLLRV